MDSGKGKECGQERMVINTSGFLAMTAKMVQGNIIGKMEIYIKEISLKI